MNGLSLAGFVRELRRRHVFHTAGLYIVGAWLVMQAADVFFPGWGLPDAAINILLATAILGFPLALVFGWFYDITADGVVRTPAAGVSDKQASLALQREDYVLLGAIGLIAAFIIYDGVQDIVTAPRVRVVAQVPDTALLEILEHSVAVLPFVNTSNDPDNEAFSDGISEEILDRLSSYTELSVIGRTSSFSFKGSDYRIPRIATLLGVRYLLQGSVRRDGDNLRILASLVNDRGEQQWSDSFDRKLENVFVIQAEIADAVAAAVVPQIAPRRASSYEPDLEAYQEYLIGRDLLWKRQVGAAADAFARATEVDPNFAKAYAELAIASLIWIPDVERGRRALETANKLQPGLPRALAAKGLLLSRQNPPDYAKLEQIYRDVLTKSPDDVDVMNWLSSALTAQGKHDEAFTVMERAVRIDPLHGVVASNLATIYAARGDVDRAEKTLLRQLELPEPSRADFIATRLFYLHTGQLVKMNAIAKREAIEIFRNYFGAVWNYALLGLWDSAERWASLSQADFPNDIWGPAYPTFVPYWQGRYAEAAGKWPATGELADRDSKDAAYFYGEIQALAGDFDGALATLEPWLEQAMLDIRTTGEMPSHALAWAYRMTGRDEEADEILVAMEQYFASIEAQDLLHGSDNLFLYAQNALLLGNHDTALDRLERAVDAGWRKYLIQRHDLRWAPLHDHRRYVSLMQRVMADIERQRAEVERIDAADDFMKRFEATRRLGR